MAPTPRAGSLFGEVDRVGSTSESGDAGQNVELPVQVRWCHVAGRAERGSGSFIITGGMPEPKPQYVSLSLGKAGVRTLVALLDQEYGPSGIHVATVTVDGEVAPGTAFDPDNIAEHYWRLHTQPRQRWEREIVYDE